MSTPRTRQRTRTGILDSPSATPPRPLTPGVNRIKGTAGATASPQVRAALAALRKNRQASTDSPSSCSPADADPFAIPAHASSSSWSRNGSREASQSSTAESSATSTHEGDDLHLEWSVQGEGKLIEAARRSGRLNLASRSLSAVPPLVYSALLPRSSMYHPSNRIPSHYRREPQPDLTLAVDGDEEERTTAWYEQQDLRTLNLANNEIEIVGDELGGFEELEVLDMHNNLLSAIPASLGYLVHLTSLSLAHNRLASFPIQILNLRHLRELSLAHNQLTHLWAADWRAQLDEVLRPPEASPSATPESASGREESFWDSFPSSPFKRAAADAPSSTAPFPFLASLSLAGNPLGDDALTLPGFELPPRLVSLDLSACGLSDRAVPPAVLGAPPALKELDLSANELSDTLFSPALFPPPSSSARLFPALDTLSLSLNPLDTLESLEALLSSSIRRPVAYVGLPHIVDNLVRNEERRTGRRVGVPEGDEQAAGARELRVEVRECPLRLEQARRRARFPATASSAARAAEQSAQAAAPAKEPMPAPAAVEARTRSPSPSPPPSPSPAPAPVPAPGTPARRRPVVLEDWEVEAAAGLSTPGARRRAAALKAQREREEAARRADERERRERDKEEEEMARRLREVRIGEKEKEKEAAAPPREDSPPASPARERSEQGSPPPYSPRTPPPAPLVSAGPVPTPAPAAAAAPVPVQAEREADPADPAVELVSSAFARSQTKATVALSGRALSALPVPTSGAVPTALSAPSHADLSRNAFSSVPLPALTAWGWAASLRVLNLSNNRLAALEVLAAAPASGSALFPALDALDLSSNFLPSHVVPPSASPPLPAAAEDGTVPLLAALAALCPALSTLSLRGNRLTSLAGVDTLLLPAGSDASARGVRRLELAENRLRGVEELVAVAERIEAGARGAWRCEELDLSMNDINALPPKLGYLPQTLVLHLVGNSFRLPRRDVYENAGERLVIPWLRDRLP
ncbi:hypothetical protein JCM10449v2_006626 [Rhodotorula kratochvilovae]